MVDNFHCSVVLTSEELTLLHALVSEPLKHRKTRRLIGNKIYVYEALAEVFSYHLANFNMFMLSQENDL